LRNVYLVASGAGGYPQGENGRVRLWLFNRSSTADALVDVRSAAAESARISWDRDCDGVFEIVDELPIRPDGTVPYDRPYALELVNFTGRVWGGTTVPVTFTFRHAGEKQLDAMVEVVRDGDVGDPVHCGRNT
jgi:copper(I)-binding protein